MKTINLLAAALLFSASVYAQSQPTAPATAHKGHRNMTPAQRATMKADRKAKFDKMTPDERKAFRETHRAQRQAKLAALPADKRAKIVARKQAKKTQRKQGKAK